MKNGKVGYTSQSNQQPGQSIVYNSFHRRINNLTDKYYVLSLYWLLRIIRYPVYKRTANCFKNVCLHLRWRNWDETVVALPNCLRRLHCNRAISILVHNGVVTAGCETLLTCSCVLLGCSSSSSSSIICLGLHSLWLGWKSGNSGARRRAQIASTTISPFLMWYPPRTVVVIILIHTILLAGQTSRIVQHVLLLQLNWQQLRWLI